MFELLTGTGLALSAGLNAYIPLLVLGVAGRYLDFVNLPTATSWLSNGWVLSILGVLLVVEMVADKIPVVDTINDTIQTFVRPTSGGIAFGTGAASETAVVTDPGKFFTSSAWVTVVIGIVMALVVHGGKTAIRPPADLATGGVAAPVLSSVEDISSAAVSILALAAPLVMLVLLIVIVGIGWYGYNKYQKFRRRFARRRDPEPDVGNQPPVNG